MKVLLFLIGIAAAGVLGYSFEPSMRYSLTGKERGSVFNSDSKTVTLDDKKGEAKEVRKIDLAKFPKERLPQKVTLKGDVAFSNKETEVTMKVSAGSKVNLVKVDGSNVVISPGVGDLEGRVPVAATNLMELLQAMPEGPVATEPSAGDQTAPETAPQTAPKTEPMAGAETTAEPETSAEPKTMEEPAPEPKPAPEPDVPAGPTDVVAVMKASIEAGDISEFSFDQVTDWEAVDEEESFDGESYKVGLLTYKAETFVGVRTIQAKALVKGNKVARWLWPKSGMEIK